MKSYLGLTPVEVRGGWVVVWLVDAWLFFLVDLEWP